MATLRKLSGKYYIRMWQNGKETTLPTNTSRKEIAEQLLKRVNENIIEVKLRLKDESEIQKKTIRECLDYFFKNYKTEKAITKTTLYSYKQALTDFENAFIAYEFIQDIKRKDYPLLLDYLKTRYKATTVNIRLRGIRVFLNYLEETEFIHMKPFKVREIKTEKKLPQYITPEEMNRFYSQITNPKHRATFRTLEYTGMRVGELPNSRRDGEFIYITQSKSKKERIVPIPPQYITDYDTATDKPLSRDNISHLFLKYARQAGIINRTLHSLRHTYALRMLVQTNNIAFVKELLGHSSVIVTEVYTQFPMNYLKQLFKRDKQDINIYSLPTV